MSNAQPDAVVLSPHLDDAVFSCPGWIIDRAKNGDHPLVIVVFSEGSEPTNDKPKGLHEKRQREDEAAVELLGATRRLAGFPEASSRSRIYQSFGGVTCQRTSDDDRVVATLRAYVRDLLAELAPRRVLAPLGVGQHVDHRLVQEVVCDLAPEHPQTQFTFYEDRPYAFVEESVRLRLAQLGRDAHADDFLDMSPAARSERFFLSFLGAPYARQHLHAADQARVVAHVLAIFARALQEPARAARSSTSKWNPSIMRELIPAFDAHASQHHGFMGSPLYHQWIALEYARRIGYENHYVERYWYL